MTRDDLIQAGYSKFHDGFKNANCAYQKRCGNTRYFINVYYYDWSKFNSIPISETYSCDLQFRTPDGEALNLDFSCTDLSVEELEEKVAMLFNKLECLPYED